MLTGFREQCRRHLFVDILRRRDAKPSRNSITTGFTWVCIVDVHRLAIVAAPVSLTALYHWVWFALERLLASFWTLRDTYCDPERLWSYHPNVMMRRSKVDVGILWIVLAAPHSIRIIWYCQFGKVTCMANCIPLRKAWTPTQLKATVIMRKITRQHTSVRSRL